MPQDTASRLLSMSPLWNVGPAHLHFHSPGEPGAAGSAADALTPESASPLGGGPRQEMETAGTGR